MKRKKARAAKPAAPVAELEAKPINELGDDVLSRIPGRYERVTMGQIFRLSREPRRTRTDVAGVPLPPDLESVASQWGFEHRGFVENFFDHLSSNGHLPEHSMTDEHWRLLEEHFHACFRKGFYLALLRYADDLKTSAEATAMIREEQRRIDLLSKQRRENGAMLAEEGRAAKAPNDAARAKWICSAYRRIRSAKPDGSRGNGAAIRDVVERYQSQTGKSITPRGVREILKRHGAMPARRKGKN